MSDAKLREALKKLLPYQTTKFSRHPGTQRQGDDWEKCNLCHAEWQPGLEGHHDWCPLPKARAVIDEYNDEALANALRLIEKTP